MQSKAERIKHIVDWYLNRWWLRWVFGFYGCKGEGYYEKEDGTIEPCYSKGCH